MSSIPLETRRKIVQITTIVGVIITIIGSIYITQSSVFKENGEFAQLLQNLGVFAPIIFIFVQISQTVYPIIPLGLTNVIGVLVFGQFWGFILNLIGMMIGSSINFYLGRRFGEAFVRSFISDEQYDKYTDKINSKGFIRLMKIGFVAPLFPDDIFCMLAGMTNLTYRQFIKIVAIYRPLSLFFYAYVSSNLIQWVMHYFFGG